MAIAAVAMALLAVAWRFLIFTGLTNDHYVHVSLAHQLLLGEWPVRDFIDPGEPLMYLVTAFGRIVAGPNLGTEWAIATAALAIGAVCTVIVAARLAGSIGIAVFVTGLEILMSPRTYGYPKVVLYAAAALLIVRLTSSGSRKLIGGAAALVAAAFLFRHDHGVYIGTAMAAALALMRPLNARAATGRVIRLTVIVALCLAPWTAYIIANGGLTSYLRLGYEFSQVEAEATMLREWPRFVRDPNRPVLGLGLPDRPLGEVEWAPNTTESDRESLALAHRLEYVRDGDGTRFYYVHDPTEENIRALVNDPRVIGTNGFGRAQRPAWRELLSYVSPFRLAPALQSRENAEAWLYYLFWALPAVCACFALAFLMTSRERWNGESAAVIAIAVMALGANTVFLRNILGARLPDACTSIAVLGAWALGRSFSGSNRWRIPATSGAIVIAFITTAAISNAADVNEQVARTSITEGWQAFGERVGRVQGLLAATPREGAPSRISAALIPFFDYVDRCTTSTDRLIVVGLNPEVAVLSGRGFAGRSLLVRGYSPVGLQGQTIETLRRQSPPLAVIPSDAYRGFERVFPEIEAYVRREYDRLAEIPLSAGEPVWIYARRTSGGGPTDPATGWPCFR